MHATIADIRRGDRYTWNNREWIAVYDAAPGSSAYINDDRFYVVRSIPAKNAQPGADGVHEVTGTISADVILCTAKVTIHERGLNVHTRQDDVREDTSKEHAENLLNSTIIARQDAQRAFEETDTEFRARVRQFLASGGSVADVVRKTGLSRERIYQIRDDRR